MVAGVNEERDILLPSKLNLDFVGVNNFEFWIFDIAVAVISLATSSLRLFEGELIGVEEVLEFNWCGWALLSSLPEIEF